jgi:hypothetical protein
MNDKVDAVVNSSRPLTLELISKSGLDDKDLNQIGIIDYLNNNQLERDDFVFVKIIIDKKNYKMIHEFPGDVPSGIIWDKKGKHYIGRSMDYRENDGSPQKWYCQITKDSTKYLDDFWYNVKLL